MPAQNVLDQFLLGKPEGVVQSAQKEWLHRFAFSVFLYLKEDLLPLRLLQNELRDVK